MRLYNAKIPRKGGILIKQQAMVIVYLMEHEVGPAFLINLLPCGLPCLSTLPLFAGLQDIIRPTNIEGWHYEM